MASGSKLYTPVYASEPTGRRTTSKFHLVESVLPDTYIEQIRHMNFDDMLTQGFFVNMKPNQHLRRSIKDWFRSPSVPTLKLSLTPTNAKADQTELTEETSLSE